MVDKKNRPAHQPPSIPSSRPGGVRQYQIRPLEEGTEGVTLRVRNNIYTLIIEIQVYAQVGEERVPGTNLLINVKWGKSLQKVKADESGIVEEELKFLEDSRAVTLSIPGSTAILRIKKSNISVDSSHEEREKAIRRVNKLYKKMIDYLEARAFVEQTNWEERAQRLYNVMGEMKRAPHDMARLFISFTDISNSREVKVRSPKDAGASTYFTHEEQADRVAQLIQKVLVQYKNGDLLYQEFAKNYPGEINVESLPEIIGHLDAFRKLLCEFTITLVKVIEIMMDWRIGGVPLDDDGNEEEGEANGFLEQAFLIQKALVMAETILEKYPYYTLFPRLFEQYGFCSQPGELKIEDDTVRKKVVTLKEALESSNPLSQWDTFEELITHLKMSLVTDPVKGRTDDFLETYGHVIQEIREQRA
jgi:hypothetical protein